MKKSILLLFVFTLGAIANAQTVKFGVKAGLNYANLNSSNIQTSAITSYHAGIVAEIKVLELFAIQPELLYSTQGATYKNVIPEIKNELGYLSIPVMAKINLNEQFAIEVGPQASFLVSKRNNFNANNPETFDFAINGGLNFKITDNLFINGRYVLGLTDVSKDAKTKNSVAQLSLGFMF